MKPIESVTFRDSVRLPNPHGQQGYASHKQFDFADENRGLVLTDKHTKREAFIPWENIGAVHFFAPPKPAQPMAKAAPKVASLPAKS